MPDGDRTAWPDPRLDEKMAAVDSTFERIDMHLADLREEMRALRSDFARTQDRLVQIGFGLVVALIGAVAALIIALTG
jgi:hypothetical protein